MRSSLTRKIDRDREQIGKGGLTVVGHLRCTSSLMRDVTPEELDRRLAEPSERLLVLYLWGPDCPNCVIFKRSLPKLLPELEQLPVDFVALDVYQYPEIARRYAVYGIPHFLLFRAGKKLGKMSEFRGEDFWLAVVREQATAPQNAALKP